ncbi:MAG: hypothetical protein ACR2HH_06785 [Chthoniobacterales bacterium]
MSVDADRRFPLKARLAIFVALWVVAGLIWATFADFNVEAGESKLAAQAGMVYLAPVMAALGLAFAVVPGGYNAWPERHTWEGAL